MVSYQLTGDGVVADWKSCADAVRGGQEFLALSGAGLVKISAPLADFFAAASTVLRNLDPVARTFEVPFFAAGYYTHLVRHIPGALVPEIAAGPEMPAQDNLAAPDFRFTGKLRSYQAEGVR